MGCRVRTWPGEGAVLEVAWVGVDVGKAHHWVVAEDPQGRVVSRKVANDQQQIARVAAEVGKLAGRLVWTVDLTTAEAALFWRCCSVAARRCAARGPALLPLSTRFRLVMSLLVPAGGPLRNPCPPEGDDPVDEDRRSRPSWWSGWPRWISARRCWWLCPGAARDEAGPAPSGGAHLRHDDQVAAGAGGLA